MQCSWNEYLIQKNYGHSKLCMPTVCLNLLHCKSSKWKWKLLQFIVQPVPTLDQQAPGYRMMPIVILIENVHLKKNIYFGKGLLGNMALRILFYRYQKLVLLSRNCLMASNLLHRGIDHTQKVNLFWKQKANINASVLLMTVRSLFLVLHQPISAQGWV